jgi:putative ABC transport system permease protein
MKIALRELRRRPQSFALAAVILTLLALLLNFLGGLLDGLIGSSTGALRAQDGDLIVYSNTAESSFLRSRIEPAQRSAIAALPGVDKVTSISLVQLGARVPGNGPRDLAAAALFGVETAPKGMDTIPADGQVVADRFLESSGVKLNQTILMGPARTPVTVVGWIDDTNYAGQGSLWGSVNTWRTVLEANIPAERLADGVVQTLLIETATPKEVATAVDAATGSTKTFTISEAINSIPGVKEQRSTFNNIIGVTIFIAIVVVALFFALLTIERTSMYGVLKAIGASSGSLFAGVVAQAVVLTAFAAIVGGGIAWLFDKLIPPGAIPLDLRPGRIISNIVFLLIAAIIGCAFSLRRVLRVDPASAIGSGS